jgi:hypothetical protein
MAAAVAFHYWHRRGDKLAQAAHLGETITLHEQVDYVVSFDRELSLPERRRLSLL